MSEALILSAVRTPIGRFLGELSSLAATQLGSVAIRAATERAQVSADAVEQVFMGQVLQAGAGQAPARQAALGGGLPDTVAATTVNKVCGSGLEAVMLAAATIRCGDCEVAVAGGMESMSLAPHLLPGARRGWKLGGSEMLDAMLHDGLNCPFTGCAMGTYAEQLAGDDGISREELDAYAAQSQKRAGDAIAEGAFDAEIVPVPVPRRDEPMSRDEGPRPQTTVDELAKLRPAFAKAGVVTAGNSSMISDGGAALLMASDGYVRQHGLKPMARVVASATVGMAPKDVFIAPAAGIARVLERAKLSLADIDLFEINEAFASQMLATMRRSHLDGANVNVHGGAIALGHPIGASGARVLVTLLHALERHGRRRGLATLCLGGGNAVAMIVERIER